MALLNETANVSAFHGVSERIHEFGRRFATWRLYRRTINELSGLSVRELNDLGIGRGDIARVAREAVYGA